MERVVIAGGTGTLGAALARRLASTHRVLALAPPGSEAAPGVWRCDLTSIPDTEVALAGARTVVVLAQARRAPARLTRAAFDDLDRLIADSLARAVRRCGATKVVLYACDETDVRPALLAESGVPVSVLTGGGPDPVEGLLQLVEAPPGTRHAGAAWSGEAPKPRARRWSVCSVQRYARPEGASAAAIAQAYFRWLPSFAPGLRVTTLDGVVTLATFGGRALVLREIRGRSEPDSSVWYVEGGFLAERPAGRLEFRVLLDGTTAMAALIGFEPGLPWPVYRVTQALLHERSMRRFGAWLKGQASLDPVAARV